MVRLIQTTFYDMRYFLLVFFFVIFSYADAFLSVEKLLALRAPAEDDGGAGSDVELSLWKAYVEPYYKAIRMSYMTAIGEFDDVFGDYNEFEWLIFFSSTMINVIVLLNALIAITGETFGTIWEAKLAQGYREKVLQMDSLQMTFSIFFHLPDDSNKRLFIAQKMISKDNATSTERKSANSEIKSLSSKVDGLKDEIMDNIDKKLQQLHDSIRTIVEK